MKSKKNIFIWIVIIAVGGIILSGFNNSDNGNAASVKNSFSAPQTQVQQNISQGLSNNNYYTNSYGNNIHSPAYSNTVPVGSSAQCRDGTYSFSQSRRGTCSHHGGVMKWLY